ncbi:retropepsin-like aspartic protease [Anaerolineales bacterium HSG6]|nr:retropepsin-like aspartic protease [Anaerolineales bacterium HSG6]
MKSQHGNRIIGKRGYGNVLIVKALFNKINRLSLLVDTGAAMTAITPQVAIDLDFDITKPSRWMEIASVHQTERVPVLRFDTVQVGGQRVSRLEVVVLPMPVTMRIDGLLGVNFLRRFRTTFEFDQATLVLRQA